MYHFRRGIKEGAPFVSLSSISLESRYSFKYLFLFLFIAISHLSLAQPDLSIDGLGGTGVISGDAASAESGTDFGEVSTMTDQTFTLNNFGDIDLDITEVTTSGSAFSTDLVTQTVDVGMSVEFTVSYIPQSTIDSEFITISSTDPSSPFVLY